MDITITLTDDQTAALERSRAGSAATSDMTLEDFALKVCTDRVNEYVSFWSAADFDAAVAAAKAAGVTAADLQATTDAKNQQTPPIKTK